MERKRRGRGEGGLYLRSDGYWVGSVSGIDGNGRRRRVTVYGKTKKLAAAKLDDAKALLGAGCSADARTMSTSQWLGQWLDLARNKLAPTTHVRYEQLIRLRLKPLVGGVRLAKVNSFTVEKMLGDMEAKQISARGRQMAFRVLSKALKDAARRKLIASNPAADVDQPRPPKRELVIYTEDETARLLAAARQHRLGALPLVAVDSGARQGELFGLKWSDVDFAAGAITIRRNLEEIRGRRRPKETKTGHNRRVDLSACTIEAMQEHRKAMLAERHAGRDAPVFCDTNGEWLRKSNFYRQVFRAWQAEADVPRRRFHDLRHGCATVLLARGIPAKIVSERLGHAKVGITLDTYSHVTPTMQRGVAETMDRFLREKTGT